MTGGTRHGWCQHHRGIQHGTCEAGVSYRALAGERRLVTVALPCIGAEDPVRCDSYTPYTEAQLAEQEREFQRAIERLAACIGGTGPCPHCGAAIERKRQVGACVYGEPCGCRLYQGEVAR